MEPVSPDLEIFSVAAERQRYTAPLLLLAGRWCRGLVWQPMMGYLAHRGWECFALEFRRGSASDALAHRQALLNAQISACSVPPITIGHDFGATLALSVLSPVRATVALAPLVRPRTPSLAQRVARALGRQSTALGNLPTGRMALDYGGDIPGGMQPEPATLLRSIDEATLPSSARSAPTIVFVGGDDRVTPPDAARKWAEASGAAFECIADTGHGLPWQPGWEKRVGTVHRWLIQTLGEDLLVPPEDEDDS